MTTMNDIAKALGVSRPVVSSVFSTRRQGTVRVSDKTRQRILEKAREMGYRPNHVARSVATGKTRVVAFVGGVMRFDFAMETLSGVMTQAERSGYMVKVMQSCDTDWTPRQIVDTLLGRRVDGVILFHFEQTQWDQLNHELGGTIPVVALSCVGTEGGLISVNSDNHQGYEQIIDHLMALGHHRIAMVGGLETAINERVLEFVQVMQQRNLPIDPTLIHRGDWELDKAQQATRSMLDRPVAQQPTAICCANDKMAMGVLRQARLMGVDVPGQLSVVGFGETTVAEMADPPLTSIEQSYNTMGQRACEQLIGVLEHGDKADYAPIPTPHLTVPTQLVVRASTAAVKQD